MWRNVARLYARTAWVMMLDADFMVCTDVRAGLTRALSSIGKGKSGEIGELARSGRAAFVIPAFEYVIHEEGSDWRVFPRDKKGLMELVNIGKIGMFHQSWAPGHNSTLYDQYYAASPGEIYKVDAYQKSYEPYVIMQRDGPPWCDERFIGYGGNKAACLFNIYISGIDFFVLPDDFLIHQSHPYAEETRKSERKHNRKVYDDFRKELCLEEMARSMRSGTLYADVEKNLRDECMKTPGVPEVVLENLQLEGFKHD
ncbi:Glycosyl-transferase for dystroglycan [Ceratobasidium sp. AG-Ba]|nr:Glycosyl-transferase for dystroglycan [Ceratobasidium sp. AG-Ba]